MEKPLWVWALFPLFSVVQVLCLWFVLRRSKTTRRERMLFVIALGLMALAGPVAYVILKLQAT